jgi:hypothetical protein
VPNTPLPPLLSALSPMRHITLDDEEEHCEVNITDFRSKGIFSICSSESFIGIIHGATGEDLKFRG